MAVIQEACVHGVSTRPVDDLVKAMGAGGMSKSQVSQLCTEIDARVNAFLSRPLDGTWPYLWLDATYVKVREGGRIVSHAVNGADRMATARGKNRDPRGETPFDPEEVQAMCQRTSPATGTSYRLARICPWLGPVRGFDCLLPLASTSDHASTDITNGTLRVTSAKSRVRESRLPGSVRATPNG